jgi:hypothetical protein
LFGHRSEDVVSSSLDVIVPEQYREAHWKAFRAVMTGSPGKLDGAVTGKITCPDCGRNTWAPTPSAAAGPSATTPASPAAATTLTTADEHRNRE